MNCLTLLKNGLTATDSDIYYVAVLNSKLNKLIKVLKQLYGPNLF